MLSISSAQRFTSSGVFFSPCVSSHFAMSASPAPFSTSALKSSPFTPLNPKSMLSSATIEMIFPDVLPIRARTFGPASVREFVEQPLWFVSSRTGGRSLSGLFPDFIFHVVALNCNNNLDQNFGSAESRRCSFESYGNKKGNHFDSDISLIETLKDRGKASGRQPKR